uniref:Uncharacterized protein LOC102803407 n=1 Tax=Saccoglossus kowalevskii TaxID=10224 RepID=A0ABM0N1A9_SACKO|nr:PREDICTED: uncharacterized protein LOC102803407 [Saccoglossus kowalevskii]
MPSRPAMKGFPDMHAYLRKGYFHELRLLVSSGADVNVRDQQQRTPLIVCSLLEEEDWAVGIARMLLENGGMIGYSDRQGLNALGYACMYQREKLVRVYLNAIDFDLNATDKLGNTALMYAAATGNVRIASLLVQTLKRYKQTVDKPNKDGMTPLLEACRRNHVDCADVLIHDGQANEKHRDKIEKRNAKEWTREYALSRYNLASLITDGQSSRSSGLPHLNLDGLRTPRSARLPSQESSRSSSNNSSASASITFIEAKQRPQSGLELSRPSSHCYSRPVIQCYSASIRERITAKFSPDTAYYVHYNEEGEITGCRMRGSPQRRQRKNRNRDPCKDQKPCKQELRKLFQRYEVDVSNSYRKRARPKTPPQEEIPPSLPSTVRGYHRDHKLSTVSEETENQVTTSRLGRRPSLVNVAVRAFARKASKEDVRKSQNEKLAKRNSIAVEEGSPPPFPRTEGAAKMVVGAFRRRRSSRSCSKSSAENNEKRKPAFPGQRDSIGTKKNEKRNLNALGINADEMARLRSMHVAAKSRVYNSVGSDSDMSSPPSRKNSDCPIVLTDDITMLQ